VGVLLHCAPAHETPDLERLLLDTARQVEGNARLLSLTVTWLTSYGHLVANHRLKQLTLRELEPEYRPALGLILDSALSLGAPRDLQIARAACNRAAIPHPLFRSQRSNPVFARIAAKNASAKSLEWGVWAPEVELKQDAIRPVTWVVQNRGFRERAIRAGDLRCSIVEALRYDVHGKARSESEVARLSGATRTAVRKALTKLQGEGAVRVVHEPGNSRDHVVELVAA
jgi:hypothetical protein